MKVKKSKINKKEFKVEFLPFEISLDVQPETNLLDAAKEADLPLKVTCGGKGTCGDCVVQILKGKYQSNHLRPCRINLPPGNMP